MSSDISDLCTTVLSSCTLVGTRVCSGANERAAHSLTLLALRDDEGTLGSATATLHSTLGDSEVEEEKKTHSQGAVPQNVLFWKRETRLLLWRCQRALSCPPLIDEGLKFGLRSYNSLFGNKVGPESDQFLTSQTVV